jgi:hypothetical protein
MTAMPTPVPDPPADPTQEPDPLIRWYDTVLRRIINRRWSASYVWCPQWWRHPEVVERVEALWLAWSALVGDEDDATGTSVWWVQHLDPHLSILTNSDFGPMANCKSPMHGDPGRHQDIEEEMYLPHTELDPGYRLRWWEPPAEDSS